jgi:hypothetical protein
MCRNVTATIERPTLVPLFYPFWRVLKSMMILNNTIPCDVWGLTWIWANRWRKIRTQHLLQTTVNLLGEHDQEAWKIWAVKTFPMYCSTLLGFSIISTCYIHIKGLAAESLCRDKSVWSAVCKPCYMESRFAFLAPIWFWRQRRLWRNTIGTWVTFRLNSDMLYKSSNFTGGPKWTATGLTE